MRSSALAAGLAALLALAGCAGGAGEPRDGGGQDGPSGQEAAPAPERQPEPAPGSGAPADPAPAPEKPPDGGESSKPDGLGETLADEKLEFSFMPVAGMKHFVDAAKEGISRETEAFMNASGMQRRPNTIFMFYSPTPFLSLVVDWNTDSTLSAGISDEKFAGMKSAYEKSLDSFGMTLTEIRRAKAGGRDALIVEYRRIRKPYLSAVSAVFYGLKEDRMVTVTYTADSYSWNEDLRNRLFRSFETFSAAGNPGGKD